MPSSKVTEKKVLDALGECWDAEVGLSVADMGLVRSVKIEGASVHLRVLFASRNCPFNPTIAQGIYDAVKAIEGVEAVEIEIVLDGEWDPSMLSERAKAKLCGCQCGAGK
jgi:ATP-binding protein involved in chromosome partitioning